MTVTVTAGVTVPAAGSAPADSVPVGVTVTHGPGDRDRSGGVGAADSGRGGMIRRIRVGSPARRWPAPGLLAWAAGHDRDTAAGGRAANH